MNIEKFITLFAWIYGTFILSTLVYDITKEYKSGKITSGGAIRFIFLVICISWILSR